jgi:hypothetical protein
MHFVDAAVSLHFRNEDNKVVNPYRWLPDTDEVDKRDKKSLPEQQKLFLKTEVVYVDLEISSLST